MSIISYLNAREIIDSKGNPTVEAEVITDEGYFGRACVPSGASVGKLEAFELKDNDKTRFNGKGVKIAVDNIKNKIFKAINGVSIFDQNQIDLSLIEIDGTENKSNIGANAILAVSLACAKAAAENAGLPLYKYIGGVNAKRLPIAMMNILNGGMHADNSLDFQEFMIVPHGFDSFKESLRAGCEIFHNLKEVLLKNKLATSVGDEGGFAPNLSSNEKALDLILEAVEKSNYKIEKEISIALDVAASSFYEDNKYNLSGNKLSNQEMISYLADLCHKYPIISIEDGLYEQDWQGFKDLNQKLGDKIQIVGDDLFVTNSKILKRGIDEKAANSILIKLNQIGTLSECLDTIEMAKNAGFKTIISHRSGETEDTTIADLSVAVNAGQIKTGSLSRTDRVCKYNQLLRIEEDLGKQAKFYRC